LVFVTYEKLDVYKRAFEAALEIHALSKKFPSDDRNQIRRSSKGICANLAEGMSKNSSRSEEKRFISIALGSCEETRVWLHFAFKLGYISPQECKAWRHEYSEIAKILYSLYEKRKAAVHGSDKKTKKA
jgi:four helix bundle protein